MSATVPIEYQWPGVPQPGRYAKPETLEAANEAGLGGRGSKKD